MRRVIFLMLAPGVVYGQTTYNPKPITIPQPLLIIPPIVNVEHQREENRLGADLPYNPWGTGFSVVTTEKIKKDPFGKPERKSVTQIVPNDVLGMPQQTLDLW